MSSNLDKDFEKLIVSLFGFIVDNEDFEIFGDNCFTGKSEDIKYRILPILSSKIDVILLDIRNLKSEVELLKKSLEGNKCQS